MKGYRTLAASMVITILGGAQQLGIINFIPEDYRGVAISSIGLIMALMRLITNSAPAKA